MRTPCTLASSRNAARALCALLLSLSALTACGRPQDPADQARLEDSVQRIQKGELVQAINAKTIEGTSSGELPRASLLRKAQMPTLSQLAQDGPITLALNDAGASARPAQDPCPTIPAMTAATTEREARASLAAFGQCMRQLLSAPIAHSEGIDYLRFFKMPAGPALSELSPMNLDNLLKIGFKDIQTRLLNPSILEKPETRHVLTDADLRELANLSLLRDLSFASSAQGIYAAMDFHGDVIQSFLGIDRYRALVLLKQIHTLVSTGTPGSSVLKAAVDANAANLVTLLQAKGIEVPEDVTKFPNTMLPIYGLQALLPPLGLETIELNANSNPFDAVSEEVDRLGGGEQRVANLMDLYRKFRDHDNPPLPAHPEPAPDAVRVALIDTGIDYVTHPDLALFAGKGRAGELAQGDFTDRDNNSYLPAMGSLAHGSGTMATLLTLVAHHSPQTLIERKLDVAMWKVGSARTILSGYPFNPTSGFNPYAGTALADSIIRAVDSNGLQPKILSVSMRWPMQKFLDAVGRPDLLKKAPWLWVVAAGNEGKLIDHGRGNANVSCFQDVPVSRRIDEHLICVGALEKGIINDRIAPYSNYGSRVDVYAYDSYIGLCPNGTSCATPAVSGAVAIVAARQPKLTPAQLKQVIMLSSEERQLPTVTAPDLAGLFGPYRKVRVFDPVTMMDKAIATADRLAGGAPAPKPENPWWWPF